MELQRKPYRQKCAAIRCLVGKMPERAVEGFKKTDLRSAECDELMEGVWLEPIKAMLQRRTNKTWTDKHRHVTKKLVVEESWVQKRVYDTGWSDEKTLEDVTQKKARRRRLCHCCVEGGQKPDPRRLGQMRAKDQHLKERLKMAKRNHVAPSE